MDRSMLHFRHLQLLNYFDQGKNAAELRRLLLETYDEFTSFERMSRKWSGRSQKFEDTNLQALADEEAAQSVKNFCLTHFALVGSILTSQNTKNTGWTQVNQFH